ncbi:hypothetical protein FDECE_17979, partial [Fusarium decemcellulare]
LQDQVDSLTRGLEAAILENVGLEEPSKMLEMENRINKQAIQRGQTLRQACQKVACKCGLRSKKNIQPVQTQLDATTKKLDDVSTTLSFIERCTCSTKATPAAKGAVKVLLPTAASTVESSKYETKESTTAATSSSSRKEYVYARTHGVVAQSCLETPSLFR